MALEAPKKPAKAYARREGQGTMNNAGPIGQSGEVACGLSG